METIMRILNELDVETMNSSREALLLHDPTYLQDQKDLDALEQQYTALDLTREQRYRINDYIACLETTKNRVNDLSYLAGFRDAILLLNRLHLLNR